jgi:PAS domain S-box-containing protein
VDPRRFQEVLAINRAIASAEEYDDVLRLVVDRTAAFTGANACILLLSGKDGLARVVRSVGIDPVQAARLAVPLTESISRELCKLLGFESPDRFVGVPVIGKEGLMGILGVYGEGPGAPQDAFDEELISAFADQAAIALDSAERMRKLRASEEKLAGIISIAADAIITVDESQRIVMFNEGAEKIFGWSREEILGKPLDVLLAERFRDIHRQLVRDFGAGQQSARKTGERGRAIFGLRKNGEEFPADAAVSRLKIGGELLFTVVLRDITEQKRIEHEEKFLADVGAVLATTLDPRQTLANIAQLTLCEFGDFCVIDFVDEQGEIRRVEAMTSDPAKTAVAEALRRYPLDRSGPHLTLSIFQSKQPQLIEEVSPETIRSLSQSEEHRGLIEAIGPRSIMGVPLVVHGRLLGALVVASCRPGRRYGASDLRLLEEVGRRAALALENSRLHRATERAVQARDDLLGIVAHDLRNPLNTILMQATYLRRPGPEVERRLRDPSEVIERAASRMNRLIQDLLDVTRMDAGRLTIDRAPLPAAQLAFDSVEAQQALAASGSLDLQVDVAPELPEIWADRDRLLQVFENLIGNATKFTARGGRITVGARAERGEVIFRVADTGAGIPADDLPHLFDRFWQARKERRGAGLGLAIVKGIVEAHGGRIWVQSTQGQGSTFHFTVPAAPPAATLVGESFRASP